MPLRYRLLITLAAWAACLPSQAETTRCTAITSVPVTLSTPGIYCLFEDFQTNFASGAAITIATSNVVIDLNTHRLGNLAAGPTTTAVGIFAMGQQSISIRNGTIRGFAHGIDLEDVSPPVSQAHIVEDLRLDRNTQAGIFLYGSNSVVRRNQIVSTGNIASSFTWAAGIYVSGSLNRIIDNDVVNTGASTDPTSYGILIASGVGSVVADNRISQVAGVAGEGVNFMTGTSGTVRHNLIANTTPGAYGLDSASSSVFYTGNVVSGFGVPYSGGTSFGPPSGLWRGTTNDSRSVIAIVLDNLTYWVLYSAPNDPSVTAGVFEGSATVLNEALTSSDGIDFDLLGAGIAPAIVQADYVVQSTLAGSVTLSAPTDVLSITASYDSAYDLIPSLAALAATYTGKSAIVGGGSEAATVTISSSGALMGHDATGCQFSGTAIPHSSGNVYDLTASFTGSACSNGTSSVSGFGYFDSASKTLYSAVLNSGRTMAFIFVGTRP